MFNATIPLIRRLKDQYKQVWYADDSAATDTIEQLHARWNRLAEHGPAFGYFPNPTKIWIVVKQEHHQEASRVFGESGINITTKCRISHTNMLRNM